MDLPPSAPVLDYQSTTESDGLACVRHCERARREGSRDVAPKAAGRKVSDRARVAESARLGPGTRVWADATVGPGAELGVECIVGERAFIDGGVRIGDRCKIQNAALIYAPAVLEDGVFVGPGAILTNDRYPRAITAEGSLAGTADWVREGVVVRRGASIGAGAVVVPGVEVGEWALVAAGALVSRTVPSHALVAGNPARRIGWVGRSGRPLEPAADNCLVDVATGTCYRERQGALEEVT